MLRTAANSALRHEAREPTSSAGLARSIAHVSQVTQRRSAQRSGNGASRRAASITSSPTREDGSNGRGRRLAAAVGLGLFGGATYMLGSIYPPESIELLFARPAPPPALAGSAEGIAHAERIEEQLRKLPHIQDLLASSSTVASNAPQNDGKSIRPAVENPATAPATTDTKAHYVVSRPFAKLPPQMMPHSLTAGSLRKPGMLAVPPLVVSKTKHGAEATGGYQGDAHAFIHLGRSLCGHDGVVHGGLLATILDETLARTAFYNLPANIGVTAHLEVDYKFPVKADQVVVVETRLKEAIGRKAYVEGEIRDLNGRVLVQSQALFVQPRHIEWLNTDAVRDVMDRQGQE